MSRSVGRLTGMDTPDRGATRLARAAAFGVSTLVLTIGAHVAAGGGLPSAGVLVALALPLTVAAMFLTGRRCGPAVLLGSLATAQVLLHETFMTLTAHVPVDLSAAGLGAQHDAHALLHGQVSAHAASAMGDAAVTGAGGRSVTMQVAHVVATVITALVLARGEQALWQMVSRLLPTLPGRSLLPGYESLQSTVLVSLPVLRPTLVSGGMGLRGPPVLFAASA
jgi:hypothetical protein